MKNMTWRVGVIALCTVALTAAVGCQDEPSGKGGEATNVQPGEKAATDGAASKGEAAGEKDAKPGQGVPGDKAADAKAADGKDGGPCEKYAAEICTAAGAQSEACAAFNAVKGIVSPKACTAGLGDMAYTQAKVKEMGAQCDELIKKLCTDLGPETQTCEMVQTMTKSFPADRCAAMMKEYPAVLAELKRREAQNKPLDDATAKRIADSPKAAFGAADAKVTIVEFSDFQCPYCSKAADVTTQVKAKYGDKVRVVFRHFPLSFHKEAHLASQASMAASDQGKFWEYHDLLFKNQKALTRPDLEKYAQELKLDMAKFKKTLDDGTYKAMVDGDFALGQEVGVDGTPTMFINGTRVANPSSFELVSSVIDKGLK